MARILITGSADGLGSLTARKLVAAGHTVVLHARTPARAATAAELCPGAAAVLVADLTSLAETKALAAAANPLGPFDAVLHNAGLFRGQPLPAVFAVNTRAPFVLSCLLDLPARLVFVSSGMHWSGQPRLGPGLATQSGYADTKLHNVLMAKAFARRWKAHGVESNSVDPGWVPTKMGGAGATDDLDEAVDLFVRLALGEGETRGQSGRHFALGREGGSPPLSDEVDIQDGLLSELAELTGVTVPERWDFWSNHQ